MAKCCDLCGKDGPRERYPIENKQGRVENQVDVCRPCDRAVQNGDIDKLAERTKSAEQSRLAAQLAEQEAKRRAQRTV